MLNLVISSNMSLAINIRFFISFLSKFQFFNNFFSLMSYFIQSFRIIKSFLIANSLEDMTKKSTQVYNKFFMQDVPNTFLHARVFPMIQ